MFSMSSESLPFAVSLEKYMKLSMQTLQKMEMEMGMGDISFSKSIPVSIGNLNGLKYNITFSENSLTQTQIVFIKDSKAFVIGYNLGETEQSKNIDDINLMINSFKMRG
jgi:hypothetical protein